MRKQIVNQTWKSCFGVILEALYETFQAQDEDSKCVFLRFQDVQLDFFFGKDMDR